MEPYNNYKTFDGKWLSRIPQSWEYVPTLRYMYSLVDYRGKTPEKVKEGVFLVTAKNIKNGRIDYEISKEFIDEDAYEEVMRRGKPEINDILFTTEAPLGEIALVDKIDIALAQRVIKFRPIKEFFNSIYLKYYFQSAFFQQKLLSLATGSTALGIKSSKLCLLRSLKPSLAEQTQIAHFLDKKTSQIDKLIEQKEKLLKLLTEKRTALITQAVTKGLDPTVEMKDSGVDWLGEIPKHWEMKRFKFCISEPLKYGANEAAESSDPEQPRFVRITDVDENGNLRNETFKSIYSEIAEPFLLEEGDLLMARSGATVGKNFLYKSNWGVACFAGYLIRARINKDIMLPEFGNLFLNSGSYWDWVKSIFIQSTIQNISAEKYANFIFALPPKQEQKIIVEFAMKKRIQIDAVIENISNSIQNLKEYREALITSAVTGQIDVRKET